MLHLHPAYKPRGEAQQSPGCAGTLHAIYCTSGAQQPGDGPHHIWQPSAIVPKVTVQHQSAVAWLLVPRAPCTEHAARSALPAAGQDYSGATSMRWAHYTT